jgi:SAM-dependent methyltransferase
MMSLDCTSIDNKNTSFWDDLCGSNFAKSLGITDHSPLSLKKYDDAYFEFYPYLKKYFFQLDIEGKTVCEIGLGYGTASSFLAQRAGTYYGIDIAAGPVKMVNYRLSLMGKPQNARQGSAHSLPFEDEALDNIVSIGCFHHTGSIEKCVNEALRCLRKGGTLLFMCYNRKSFRMLKQSPRLFFGSTDPVVLSEDGAALYDVNEKNEAAPYTELSSKQYLEKICEKFSHTQVFCENWEGASRKYFLKNMAQVLGLDLYVIARK